MDEAMETLTLLQCGKRYPLPEEADEPEIVRLQRRVIDFNRRDFGRLHRFIDALNN